MRRLGACRWLKRSVSNEKRGFCRVNVLGPTRVLLCCQQGLQSPDDRNWAIFKRLRLRHARNMRVGDRSQQINLGSDLGEAIPMDQRAKVSPMGIVE